MTALRNRTAFVFQRGAAFFGVVGIQDHILPSKPTDINYFNRLYHIDDGTAVTVFNTPEVDFIVDGTKHLFLNSDAMLKCGFELNKNVEYISGTILGIWDAGIPVDPKDSRFHLSSYKGVFRDGEVIRTVYSKDIFIILNGTKHAMPTWDALLEAGFDGTEVQDVPPAHLYNVPTGEVFRAKQPQYQKWT